MILYKGQLEKQAKIYFNAQKIKTNSRVAEANMF